MRCPTNSTTAINTTGLNSEPASSSHFTLNTINTLVQLW